tara:strand:+ start:5391 stop:6176 length:786 start_codon:yes stop_codon:yes gene_type:complete
LGTTAALLALSAGFTALPAAAQTAVERGLEIAVEADRRDIGFGDTKANMTMTLKSAQGETATRSLRIRTLEQTDDGDKSMIIFDTPGDVKGTAFLSFTHKQGADDQWLYLPSLKRVKRISQSNQSGPFVGSEFAYEDLSSQEVEKYTYKYVRDESFDGRDHFVIETDPVNPKSGYSRQLVYFDKEHYRPWKIEFFDRRGSHMKTLTVSGYKQYLGKYWRADRQDMVNHLTGKSTTLSFGDYVFNNGFKDRDFKQNALKKAR